jgi:predicted small secreted protein
MIKKLLLLAFAAFSLITCVTGCRTAHGAGEDMERAGEKIQDKTDR